MAYVALNVILLFAVTFLVGIQCREWKPEDYPDPMLNFTACGNSVPTHFCDPDGFVTGECDVIARLEQFTNDSAETLESAHRCWKQGVIFYVAVLDKVERNPGESAARATQRFAQSLAAQYSPDRGACGRYIVTVLAVGEKQIYSIRGKGVSLTHEQFQSAAMRQRHNFRQGDYRAGLLGLVTSYDEDLIRLSGSATEQRTRSDETSEEDPQPEIPL